MASTAPDPVPRRTGWPALAALGAVVTQISYPLLSGVPLRVATITAVLLFATASVGHAGVTYGPAAAGRLLLVAGGIGLFAEAVGVSTGVPFGSYHYSGSLGPRVLGVPLLVPLAWTMMAYPCLLLGRGLARGTTGVLLGAFTLAAWDLYLDPQMVAAGHWSWRFPDPGLPGVPGVPLTNYAGWIVVSLAMVAALDRALPARPRAAARPANSAGLALPAVLLGWTWLGSALGNLVFFHRPAVAVYGGVAMGLTTLPYLLLVRRRGGAAGAGGRR